MGSLSIGFGSFTFLAGSTILLNQFWRPRGFLGSRPGRQKRFKAVNRKMDIPRGMRDSRTDDGLRSKLRRIEPGRGTRRRCSGDDKMTAHPYRGYDSSSRPVHRPPLSTATLSFDYDNQVPTTEGVGGCPLPAQRGHRYH